MVEARCLYTDTECAEGYAQVYRSASHSSNRCFLIIHTGSALAVAVL